MSDRDEGGLSSLLGKAAKWLKDQGVTKEALEKAKADHDAQEADEAEDRTAGERADRASGVGDSLVESEVPVPAVEGVSTGRSHAPSVPPISASQLHRPIRRTMAQRQPRLGGRMATSVRC